MSKQLFALWLALYWAILDYIKHKPGLRVWLEDLLDLLCLLTCPELSGIAHTFLSILQNLPAAYALPSRDAGKSLSDDLKELQLSVNTVVGIIQLVKQIINDAPDDQIWDTTFRLVSNHKARSALTAKATAFEQGIQTHTIYGLQRDWEDEYLRESHLLLKRLLQKEDAAFNENEQYARVIPILQSSGMGKSRLLGELSKEYLAISFVLRRDPYSGYPFGDPEITEYLLRTMSKEERHSRYIALISSTLGNRKMIR